MVRRYEIFDDEGVQVGTRRHAALLAIGVGVLALLTGGIVAMGYLGLIALKPFVAALAAVWFVMLVNVFTMVSEWRSLLWCVKVTAGEVAVFDTARRRKAMLWTEIRRIEVTSLGVSAVGPKGRSLEVPRAFSEFARLSHSLVELAEQYRIPVFIEGQPWQNVDVYALFPELLADAEG